MDTKRRRHQRLFRDYSAHRFRSVFRAITMGHTAAQVLGWTPRDGGTNDYFAIIRPIGFAVYFGQPMVHTSQHIGPTTHPSLSMPPLPFSLHPSHRPTPHHTHNTRHTTHHTHTSQVLGWTPSGDGTNDYFATIRSIGFAVCFGQPR